MLKDATQIVHWPGEDWPACDEHASKLSSLARRLGFTVTMTPCESSAVCLSCLNEETNRRKQNGR